MKRAAFVLSVLGILAFALMPARSQTTLQAEVVTGNMLKEHSVRVKFLDSALRTHEWCVPPNTFDRHPVAVVFAPYFLVRFQIHLGSHCSGAILSDEKHGFPMTPGAQRVQHHYMVSEHNGSFHVTMTM